MYSITITPAPSISDPLDQQPIFLNGVLAPNVPDGPIGIAARGWTIRLAIWVLRRYVAQVCSL
jgi:hypothetical protein